MPEPPSETEIQRLLTAAARESEQNAGAEEAAARSAMLVARSRRMAQLSIRFDMVQAVAWLALAVFLLLALHVAFNSG